MMLLLDGFIKEGSGVSHKLEDATAWQSLPRDTAWLSIEDYNNSRNWSVWTDIIQKMYGHLPLEVKDKIKGFEYWGNQIAGYDSLPWHQDKDEHVFASSGETVSPNIGFVYYPYEDLFTGGYLEVAVNDDFDEIERIQPKFNRLIMFDPSQYHRVSRVHTGSRRAFIVNVWTDHIPQVSNYA
jgi:hypothetical protein